MQSERRGAVVLGTILILIGGAFLVSNAMDLDLDVAWPAFVIVPGLALFLSAFLVGRGPGTGLAIAGSIVSTVGVILAVQEAVDAYGTWAYAWALVAPGSVGLGMILYGLLGGQPKLVEAGVPALGAGLALFLAFGAFFEGVIGLSGEPLLAIGDVLPIVLIGLGGALVIGSLLGRRRA